MRRPAPRRCRRISPVQAMGNSAKRCRFQSNAANQTCDLTAASSWIARLSPANDGEIQVSVGIYDQLADLRQNLLERFDVQAAARHLRRLGILRRYCREARGLAGGLVDAGRAERAG